MKNQTDTYWNNPGLSKVFIGTWLIILIFIAIFIDIHGVLPYSYSDDELLLAGMVKATSFKQMLRYSLYETHPPLGNILHYYWQNICDAIWFTRLLALLFAIALIPLYYLIGKRLDGPFAGLSAAALVTFSNGCIVQSYTARNYTPFLLFLSGSLYYWLAWREKPTKGNLLRYTLCGILAGMTHFFAILGIAPIAALETLHLWRSRQKRPLVCWITANLLLGAACILVMLPWKATLALADRYSSFPGSFMSAAMDALTFPTYDLAYLLPSPYAFYLLILLFALRSGKHSKRMGDCLMLAGGGIGIKMCMVVALHYSSAGTRHDLWLLPLVVPCAVLIISDVAATFPGRTKLFAIALIIAGVAAYNPAKRFSDADEYTITLARRAAMQDYLSALGPHDAVVSERDEAFQVMDIYPYLGNHSFTGDTMALAIAYHRTHLIINPYYRRLRTRNLLLKTLVSAQQQHMLDGVDRLVFLHSLPQSALIACPSLRKQIVAFPPVHEPVTQTQAFSNPTILLIVSKQDIFRDVMSADGTSSRCLKEDHYLENFVEPPPGNLRDDDHR